MKQSFIVIIILLMFLNCEKKQSNKNVYNNNDSLNLSFSKVYNTDKSIDTFFAYKSFNYLKKNENLKINRLLTDSLTNIFYDIGNIKKYNEITFFYLQQSIRASDTLLQLNALRHRGNFFFKTEKLDSSFYYYVKAEKLYSHVSEKKELANILLKKGIVQSKINDLIGSDLSLSQAYYVYKKTNNYKKTYVVLNELGLIYRELNDFEKSLSCHKKALDIVIKQNLSGNNEKENCLCNIGLVYEFKKNYKKANLYYRKSLENKATKNENPSLYSILIDNLAYSKLKLNDTINLLPIFKESLRIRDSIGDKSFVSLSNIHISEYYKKVNNPKLAVAFANTALAIAKKSKIPVDIVGALKQAAAVDKANASAYTNDYIRINDSLQIAERKNLDRFARIQLETDEVIKENEVLGTINQNLIYYLFGSLLVFSLAFIVYNQKQKQKIFELKQIQQETNQEIYNLLTNQQEEIEKNQIKEKNRMSRELHDGILSQLFGLRLSLEGVNSDTSTKATELRVNYIEELKEVEQQIREISHELNTEKAKINNNFVAIVIKLLEKQKESFGSNLIYDINKSINWSKFDNTAKINCYRILQESLQNINKYSDAKHIKVVVNTFSNTLKLTIEDDGKGFDAKKKSRGIGINNMIERAEESLGSYNIESEKNKGTKTTLLLPYKKTNTNQIIA